MKFLIWWNNDTWYWTLHDGTHQLARSAGRYATEEECRASIIEFKHMAAWAPVALTDEHEIDQPER